MRRIKRLLNKILLATASSKGVIKFYQKQGMHVGTNCDINKNVNIITEPYLITLGNYVRITCGVKFITHDGGLYVARNYPGRVSSRYALISNWLINLALSSLEIMFILVLMLLSCQELL